MYLKLMFNKPSYYLEDLKLLRMEGAGLYTLLCFVPSGILSLDDPTTTLPDNLNNVRQSFWFSC